MFSQEGSSDSLKSLPISDNFGEDPEINRFKNRKQGEGWEYPDHRILLLECGLLPMNTYIERRRGTLWQSLETNIKTIDGGSW